MPLDPSPSLAAILALTTPHARTAPRCVQQAGSRARRIQCDHVWVLSASTPIT